MIEITKDHCTRMLVWDDNEDISLEAMVYAKVEDSNLPYKVLFDDGITGSFKHAKPLPEPKKMSALDVMWWMNKVESEGKFIVVQHSLSVSIGVFFTNNSINNKIYDIGAYKFNELIRKDGKTTLLYDEWKEFNFENCKMEENK